MQPQVKCLLNSKPVGKTKAKNTQIGMSPLPQEFLDRPIPGPEVQRTLSPFPRLGKMESSTQEVLLVNNLNIS